MYFPAFVKTVQAGSVAWRIVRRFYSLIDKQLPEVSESSYTRGCGKQVFGLASLSWSCKEFFLVSADERLGPGLSG
jgi:hypothetical protein